MTIAHQRVDDVHVFDLQGQLNSGNAAAAESDILAQVTGGARKVVLDLTALDYISSAGLRVLLVTAKRLKQAGGKLVLAGMQPHVREVFDVSGFLAILNVVPDRPSALGQFAGT